MLGSGEGPSVANLTFVTPFPCLQNRQWVIMFAETIHWWEELDYIFGLWLFAHMLSKPFLCSCFVTACLSFPSPCLWHSSPSSQGNQVGRATRDSLDRPCTPVLSITCQLTLEGLPLSPGSADHSSDVPRSPHCLNAAAVRSLWIWPILSKQKADALIFGWFFFFFMKAEWE